MLGGGKEGKVDLVSLLIFYLLLWFITATPPRDTVFVGRIRSHLKTKQLIKLRWFLAEYRISPGHWLRALENGVLLSTSLGYDFSESSGQALVFALGS